MVFWNVLEKLHLRLKWDFISVFLYVMGEDVSFQGDGSRLFPEVLSERARAAIEKILTKF